MKFDLHMHSRFSPDSNTCPKDIVERVLKLGYSVIAITDHDSNAEAFDWLVREKVIAPSGLLSVEWAKQRGFPNAVLRIIPGQEISTATGHLLCIGARLKPSWGIDASTAVEMIHDQGGLAIAAHPFDHRRAAYSEEEVESVRFDAIEVFNGGATNQQVNELALALAARRGLPGVANSDGHTVNQIGRAHSETEASQLWDLARLLENSIVTHTGKLEPRVV